MFIIYTILSALICRVLVRGRRKISNGETRAPRPVVVPFGAATHVHIPFWVKKENNNFFSGNPVMRVSNNNDK